MVVLLALLVLWHPAEMDFVLVLAPRAEILEDVPLYVLDEISLRNPFRTQRQVLCVNPVTTSIMLCFLFTFYHSYLYGED